MPDLIEQIVNEVREGRRYWLFLDYDGTLADFAPSPEDVIFDAELNEILRNLECFRKVFRIVVLSGRSLRQIERLLPVSGILLAGTYGVEFVTWEGKRGQVVDFHLYQMLLAKVKGAWEEITDGRPGYFIEDKGVALALHGKLACEEGVETIFGRARSAAEEIMKAKDVRILGGERFLEVAPVVANKGRSVEMFLERFPWENAGMIYLGDDEKDEEAFEVLDRLGGITVLVSQQERPTLAKYRLRDPQEARAWLRRLDRALNSTFPG